MSSFASDDNRIKRASIYLQDNKAEVLEFDAIINEIHQSSATVTDHPVEEGSDITDHVRRNPSALSCRIIVTDHPIIVDRLLNAKPSVPGGDVNSRAEDAYEFLKKIMKESKLVGFFTTLQTYSNMAILSISTTRDKDTSNIVDIDISIREIIVANTETIKVPEPVNPSRKKRTNLGEQPTTDPPASVERKNESIFDKVFL